MYQQAALRRNTRRVQAAVTASLPAPVGGWNDHDSLALMPPEDAVILDNWFPYPSRVAVRKGCASWATDLGAEVESLLPYEPQTGTAKLFAAADQSIFDATLQGAVGPAAVSSLSNARWQSTNISTAGGTFLMAVNGEDKLRGYTGSAWWKDGDGAHDITGVDTANCINIMAGKRRIWLVENNTCNAWYLPTDSIAGAASKLDFGSIFAHGGFLMATANWTLDGGNGPDDYTAFIGSSGDVAIYKGTDPSSVTTWQLVGVFWLGPPIGRRCVCQYRGDVILISQDGVYPLSQALTANRTNTGTAYTNKIQNTMSASATNYGRNFGWEAVPFPGNNMLILNVPVAQDLQHQYVMNTITGAWCRFKGWGANTFKTFQNGLFFGGNGTVFKAWQAASDAGVDIAFEALQAFNYFGSSSSLKQWTLARPIIATNRRTGVKFGINVDFDRSVPAGGLSFTISTAGKWGSGKWGSATWGGSLLVQKTWQSVSGIGYCAAMHITGTANQGALEWSATDFAFLRGGVL